MKLNWIKPPRIVKKIFYNHIWEIPNTDQKVFLTFDDGPIPEVTPWVLAILENYNVKATFFCIGENVSKYPEVLQQVLDKGHMVGNHTYNHLNGWKTSIKKYIENTQKSQDELDKFLTDNNKKIFRPPYGKIKPLQSRRLRKLGYKIIMWDVLSVDYDINMPKEQCLQNVLDYVESGSIIVFHDSIKAQPRLEFALPKVIEWLKNKGYSFDVLS